jgi:DNA-binding MurR/RpiR family transcriptional regulator
MSGSNCDPATPPSSVLEIKSRIVARQLVFPEGIVKIARLAFERPELFAFESAATIARICGVSERSVIRFSRSLGHTRFKDTKRLFQDEVVRRSRPRLAAG